MLLALTCAIGGMPGARGRPDIAGCAAEFLFDENGVAGED